MADRRSYRATTTMSEWNSVDIPCFAAQTVVALSGGARVRIADLQRGVRVETPKGPKRVAAVLVTPVRRAEMVDVDGVLVTPWHPVLLPGGAERGGCEWVFPCQASEERVRYTGCIYSILLEKDKDVDSHAIMLGDGECQGSTPFWGVTLGHGMLRGSDPRAHTFFGNYERVASSVKGLKQGKKGRFLTGGTKRSMRNGLIYGFEMYSIVALVARVGQVGSPCWPSGDVGMGHEEW